MSHGNMERCEPNLTPMLDMVLQLVMFFMLCANFVMEQVNESIKLPEAVAAKPLDRKDERLLFLNVNTDGKVLLSKLDAEDSLSLDNKIQLKSFMERRMKRDKQTSPDPNAPILSTIIVRADRHTKFEKINDVMEGCRAAGYKQIRLRARSPTRGSSMSRKKRTAADIVEPDLPITPMLDMSFQLMAFFILTFRPMPTEGQMALALPDKIGGGSSISDPLSDNKADDVTVTVDASAEGRIAGITLSDSTGSSKEPIRDIKAYQKALKDKAEKAKPKLGKLKIEMDKDLLHEYVVQLIDIGVRAGFTDISPEPRKAGGAK